MSACPCRCDDCYSGVHDESWQACCAYAREVERLELELELDLAAANATIDVLLFLLDDVGVDATFIRYSPDLTETERGLALAVHRMYLEDRARTAGLP